MKNSTYKLIVTLLLLVIIVGGSVLIYRYLQDVQGITAQIPTEPVDDSLNKCPDFHITDRDGNQIALSDFTGKPVVVNFWASWCGPCKSEMPHFQAAYDKYGDQVHFLMVNLHSGFGDSYTAAEKVLADGEYTFPVYYDTGSECAIIFGINAVPVTAFIDDQGNLIGTNVGMMTAQALESAIESLLSN